MLMTRRNFVLGSSALGLGAILSPSALARSRNLEQILDWTRLTDHTRAVVNLALGGNSMLIASAGEALVVDSKFPYLGTALYQDASEAGDAVSLINTHHHGDHTGGNSAFVGRGKTYAHPNAIERIRGQIDRYRSGAESSVGQVSQNLAGNKRAIELAIEIADNAANLKADDFVPTDVVEGGSQIKVGELTLDIHHFGAGHTDNDLVVHLPSENLIHTGDLVFNGLNPFYDPNGGVSPKGWIESLNRVYELCDAETTVVPGHGEVGGREIIAEMRSYHEELIDVVMAEIKKGTPREEVVEMVWPFMEGRGFKQITGRAIGVVYDDLKSD